MSEQGKELLAGFFVYRAELFELHRVGGTALGQGADRSGVAEGAGERDFGGHNLMTLTASVFVTLSAGIAKCRVVAASALLRRRL